MSNEAKIWVDKQYIKPAGAKFVLRILAEYCDVNGFCFCGQERLASMTSQGLSTVRGHLKMLEGERYGLIERARRWTKNGQRSYDGFQLNVPWKPRDPVAAAGEPEPETGPDPAPPTLESLPPRSGGYNRQDPARLPPGSSTPTARIQHLSNDDKDLDRDLDRGGGGQARARLDISVYLRVLELIGVDQSWPGYMVFGEVDRWIDAGADADLDIYPTIREVMASRHSEPPRGLRYFRAPVMRALADRGSPIEVPVARVRRPSAPRHYADKGTQSGLSPTAERACGILDKES